jgi:hypothetical protein
MLRSISVFLLNKNTFKSCSGSSILDHWKLTLRLQLYVWLLALGWECLVLEPNLS